MELLDGVPRVRGRERLTLVGRRVVKAEWEKALVGRQVFEVAVVLWGLNEFYNQWQQVPTLFFLTGSAASGSRRQHYFFNGLCNQLQQAPTLLFF